MKKISYGNLKAKIRKENEIKLKSIKGDVLKSWLNPHKSFSFFKTVELLPFLIFSLQLYIISIFVFTPLHKIIFLKTELKNCLKFSFFFLRQKNEKPKKKYILKKWRRRRDVWVGWQVVSTTLTKQNKVENSENLSFYTSSAVAKSEQVFYFVSNIVWNLQQLTS